MPDSVVTTLVLQRRNALFSASLCLNQMSYEELCIEQSSRPFLHLDELDYFDSLPPSARRESYLMGRYCVKQAARHYAKQDVLGATMLIRYGVFHQPLLQSPHISNVQISVTHTSGFGGALVVDEAHPMAIDMERPGMQQIDVVNSQITEGEKALLSLVPWREMGWAHTWLWTVKEALGKVLRTGLMVPMHLYEVRCLRHTGNCIVAEFVHFTQYKVISFVWNLVIVSIVLPRRTELHTVLLREVVGSQPTRIGNQIAV
jgi:4'-phosphopantetheinyl transferase